MRNSRKRNQGQATVEYTVATFALLVAIFVPWDGEQSAAVKFMEAARQFHANSSFALSLP